MSIKSGRLADRHRYVLCDVDDRRDGISRQRYGGTHASDHPLLAGHDAFGWGRRLLRLERLGFFGCWRLEMFVGDGGFQLLQPGGAEVDLQVFVGA